MQQLEIHYTRLRTYINPLYQILKLLCFYGHHCIKTLQIAIVATMKQTTEFSNHSLQ